MEKTRRGCRHKPVTRIYVITTNTFKKWSMASLCLAFKDIKASFMLLRKF